MSNSIWEVLVFWEVNHITQQYRMWSIIEMIWTLKPVKLGVDI